MQGHRGMLAPSLGTGAHMTQGGKISSSLHEPTLLPSGCDLLVSICPFYRALTALGHSGLDQGETFKAAQRGKGLCFIYNPQPATGSQKSRR